MAARWLARRMVWWVRRTAAGTVALLFLHITDILINNIFLCLLLWGRELLTHTGGFLNFHVDK